MTKAMVMKLNAKTVACYVHKKEHIVYFSYVFNFRDLLLMNKIFIRL